MSGLGLILAGAALLVVLGIIAAQQGIPASVIRADQIRRLRLERMTCRAQLWLQMEGE